MLQPPPAIPHLPELTPPLLYLLLSVYLLHDCASFRRTRATSSPSRIASWLLCMLTVSLCIVSTFHIRHTTRGWHGAKGVSTRDALSLHPLLRQVQTPAPGNPVLPPPISASATPSPVAPAAPSVPVTQAPVVATGVGGVQQPPVVTVGVRVGPTLDECRGGLLRMQVLLLLEFLAECAFLVLKWLSTNDEDEPTCDISFRVFTLFRAVYAVPVVALNASILFIGGSPTGSCLPANPAVQVAYTHLILYALFTIVFLVFAMVRLINYDSEKDDTTTGYYYGTRTSYTGSLGFPPSRTESYYRRRTRRSSTDYYSDDDTGFWGTVCPCC